jgi:hypothetical protein
MKDFGKISCATLPAVSRTACAEKESTAALLKMPSPRAYALGKSNTTMTHTADVTLAW